MNPESQVLSQGEWEAFELLEKVKNEIWQNNKLLMNIFSLFDTPNQLRHVAHFC